MEEKETYNLHIPINIARCKKLPAGARLLYGEIAFICNRDGYCMKQSPYFAKLYGVYRETISVWIKSLHKNKFIKRKRRGRYTRFIFLPGTDIKYIRKVLKTFNKRNIDALEFSNEKHIDALENSNDLHKVNRASKNALNNTSSFDDDIDFNNEDIEDWLDNINVK